MMRIFILVRLIVVVDIGNRNSVEHRDIYLAGRRGKREYLHDVIFDTTYFSFSKDGRGAYKQPAADAIQIDFEPA